MANSTREAIADFASAIPGYGPSDVFYPDWFLGEWQATSELSAVETPQGDALAGEAALRARSTVGTEAAVERYPQRYVDYRGHIIADRAFNVQALVKQSGARSVESVDWSPSNPNVLSMVLKRDGVSVQTDMRVTRRATGAPEGRDDLFNVSEFYQEVVESSSSDAVALGYAPGPPKVTPVRCVNKFKRAAGPQIQALQRVEVFPLGNSVSPDFGDLVRGGNPDKPVVVYRYRALLTPASEGGGA